MAALPTLAVLGLFLRAAAGLAPEDATCVAANADGEAQLATMGSGMIQLKTLHGKTASAEQDPSRECPPESPSSGGATVHALLCVTDGGSDPRAKLLKSKLALLGYRVALLDCDAAFQGSRLRFGLRLRAYSQAVACLPDDSLIVVLDAYDMLVYGNATEAVQRFKELRVPLVASCTVATWPPVAECPAYAKITPPYASRAPLRPDMYNDSERCKFPCGGAMMGTKAAFVSLYGRMGFNAMTDDQCWLHTTLSHMAPGKDWALDYDANLFLEYQSMRGDRVKLNAAGRLEVSHSPAMQAHPTFVHLDSLHPDLAKLQAFYQTLT